VTAIGDEQLWPAARPAPWIEQVIDLPEPDGKPAHRRSAAIRSNARADLHRRKNSRRLASDGGPWTSCANGRHIRPMARMQPQTPASPPGRMPERFQMSGLICDAPKQECEVGEIVSEGARTDHYLEERNGNRREMTLNRRFRKRKGRRGERTAATQLWDPGGPGLERRWGNSLGIASLNY